jgi:hypothetical protein
VCGASPQSAIVPDDVDLLVGVEVAVRLVAIRRGAGNADVITGNTTVT